MFDQREEVSLYREGGGEDHGVEVDPQLANVAAAPVRDRGGAQSKCWDERYYGDKVEAGGPAEGVDAGVGVGAGAEGRHDGVRVVLGGFRKY